MADRYPLVVASGTVQELALGDSLDLSGSSIKNLTISGVTTVAAGSAAAPSITPTGDSNTGIFFPSADTIAFGEGGVEAVRIDSSGNIGIAISNPTSRLHVAGNTFLNYNVLSAASLTFGASCGQILRNEDSELAFGLLNVSPFPFWIQARTSGNAARDIALNPLGGNIGIGTTIPGEKLQVDGNLRLGVNDLSNYIAFRGTAGDNPGGYNHTYIGERVYSGEGSELFLFKGNDYEASSGYDRIRLAAGEIRFDTYSSTTVSGSFESVATSANITNKMTLTGAGNLGIGTTNPGEKLQVDGNLRVGLSTVENYIAFHGTYGDGAIGAGVSEGGYSLYTHSIIGERIYDSTTQRSELLLVKSNDQSSGEGPDRIRLQAGAIVFDTYSVNQLPLSFAGIATAGVRRMEITPGGTVVVGAALSVGGALSKGSGSFRIPHPIAENKDLVHSFIEGPRADLIYRGTVTLSGGTATVNLDEEYELTAGTWNALCRNPQVWVTSDTGWTLCKGSVVEGVLTIEAQTSTCTETVSWLVVAERKDAHMYETEWTDENGRPILEPIKE